MDISFLHPGLLWAAGAAAAPAIIHLLVRRPPREQDFPALRFIRQSAKASAFRFRLKHLLLLLVRCAIVALAAALLARPVARMEGAAGAGRAVVRAALVFDDSASMLYQQDGRTRLDAAKELALKLLDSFDAGSEAAVLTASRPVGGLTYDLAAAREQIRALKPRPVSARLWPAIRHAQSLLRGDAAGLETYVFTDLTAQAFKDPPPVRPAWNPRIGLCFVDVGALDPDNFAVTRVEASRRRAPVGAPVRVRVQIRAAGPGGARVVQVRLDGRAAAQRRVAIPGRGAATAEFELVLERPGWVRGEVAILGADPLPLDNTRHFTLFAAPPPRVLCVDGAPGAGADDELFYLRRALRPRPDVRGPSARVVVARAEDRWPNDWDAAILCNVARFAPAKWSALAERVAGGRGLIVFAGDRLSPDNYNAGPAAALMPARLERVVTLDPPARFVIADPAHPLAAAFRGGRNGDLTGVEFSRVFLTALTPRHKAARQPFRLGPAPGVLIRPYQAGVVAWVAVPADADWGDWTKRPCYPPFLYELLQCVLRGQPAPQDLIVGQPAALALEPRQLRAAVLVRTPDRPKGRRAAIDSRGLTARFADTFECGWYEWVLSLRDRRTVVPFAVNLDPAESDLRRVSRKQAAALFPGARPLFARDAPALRRAVRRARVGREAFPLAALALLALLVWEAFLANRYYAAAAEEAVTPLGSPRGA